MGEWSKGPRLEHPNSANLREPYTDMTLATPIAQEQRLIPSNASYPSLNPGTPHRVSRTERPADYPDRGRVPEDFGADYSPVNFVHPRILEGPDWAEPVCFEEAVQKRAQAMGLEASEIAELFPSYEPQQIIGDRPRNPRGPTGIEGQGLLGKHGSNFACDPIVFRRHKDPDSGLWKLQMIAIQRRDNGRWAIPGGMADFGESVSQTLARELREEALGEGVDPEVAVAWENAFKRMFEENSFAVYSGAVDDFRNTDTSWMETAVRAFELSESQAAELKWDMTLHPGDDARDAQWMSLTKENLEALNANHGDFVARAVQLWQERTGLVVRRDGVLGRC